MSHSPPAQASGTECHYYVAQAPLDGPLAALRADCPDPPFLNSTTAAVHSRNLWMSFQATRSSVHYDHAHNVLCAVTGRKIVTLWPPSASSHLRPESVLGESANHAGVRLTDAAALAAATRAAGSLGMRITLQVRVVMHLTCMPLAVYSVNGRSAPAADVSICCSASHLLGCAVTSRAVPMHGSTCQSCCRVQQAESGDSPDQAG